ncbi:helix-turn-helix domain-containing protein [Actinomadura adrarensis]|uniref:Helix-turn-helix domain-containing protein n=1 Tax=Actinomadura adrarensis TaxID=1819600 RepID=A0ABW3CTW8_9ACTN
MQCRSPARRRPRPPDRSWRSPVSSPFVRRNRLATELRALREQRGMTAEDLSRQIFRSRVTISKLENARCRPQLPDVLKILDALGVDDGEWRRILDIARDAAERGWWDGYGDAMGARQRLLADIESGADNICEYNQNLLPGLLQSPEYMRALIKLEETEGSKLNYVPEQSIKARLRRQEAALRVGGPHCEIIIDELVLRWLVVPPSIMAAQIRHMVEVITHQPRFTILVLPIDAHLPPGRPPASAHMLFTFPDPDDPPIVIAETSTHLVHTDREEVEWYVRLHARLRQAALPSLESLSLMADTADRLTEQAGPNVKQQYSSWRKSSHSERFSV